MAIKLKQKTFTKSSEYSNKTEYVNLAQVDTQPESLSIQSEYSGKEGSKKTILITFKKLLPITCTDKAKIASEVVSASFRLNYIPTHIVENKTSLMKDLVATLTELLNSTSSGDIFNGIHDLDVKVD